MLGLPLRHPSLLWDGKRSFVFICEAADSVLGWSNCEHLCLLVVLVRFLNGCSG